MFHLNSKDAANALGCAHSKLKRLCRHFRISRWPHRKLSSLEHLRDTINAEERMGAPQKQVGAAQDRLQQRLARVVHTVACGCSLVVVRVLTDPPGCMHTFVYAASSPLSSAPVP